jgi:hypothetical protein
MSLKATCSALALISSQPLGSKLWGNRAVKGLKVFFIWFNVVILIVVRQATLMNRCPG